MSAAYSVPTDISTPTAQSVVSHQQQDVVTGHHGPSVIEDYSSSTGMQHIRYTTNPMQTQIIRMIPSQNFAVPQQGPLRNGYGDISAFLRENAASIHQ
jgi:hypothetical protein